MLEQCIRAHGGTATHLERRLPEHDEVGKVRGDLVHSHVSVRATRTTSVKVP